MYMSLSESELQEYLLKQVNCFFPDKNLHSMKLPMSLILRRVENCFSEIENKYFRDNDKLIFNHLHADQYSMFLYFASNTVYKEFSDKELASKIYMLNRTLNSIDVYYEVDLPEHFLFVHPIGTVLGRAKYGDHLVVYQKCNIGGNNGKYPIIGDSLNMYAGSVLLGESIIGNNCCLAAGSFLIDSNLPDNSTYFGIPNCSFIRENYKSNRFWQKYDDQI